MGAGASALQHSPDFHPQDPHADAEDGSPSVLMTFLRRRSSVGSSGSRRSSAASVDTTKADPVKPNILNVRSYDRHPFTEFRFLRKLGEGSFSTVHKAVHVVDEKKKVAIKEIDVHKLSKQQASDLHLEVNILSQLHHPSIVRLLAVYTVPSKMFVVMEYLRGGELLTALCRRERYHENDARRVIWQVASALQYMHARQVMHRDLKPMNLMLSEKDNLDSMVKIVDFGFATIESEDWRRPGRFLCGTPGYMAPEVLSQRSYTCKVDIWGLGVILYVLLSGWMPFPTNEAGEEFIKAGQFVFPELRFGRVTGAAKDLLRKMLTVDVEQRYSAQQVLQHPWMQVAAPELTKLSAITTHRTFSADEGEVFDINAADDSDSDAEPAAIVEHDDDDETTPPLPPPAGTPRSQNGEDEEEEDDEEDEDRSANAALGIYEQDGDLSSNLPFLREYCETSLPEGGFMRRLWHQLTGRRRSEQQRLARDLQRQMVIDELHKQARAELLAQQMRLETKERVIEAERRRSLREERRQSRPTQLDQFDASMVEHLTELDEQQTGTENGRPRRETVTLHGSTR